MICQKTEQVIKKVNFKHVNVWNKHSICVSKLFICVSTDLPPHIIVSRKQELEATLRSHCILPRPYYYCPAVLRKNKLGTNITH